ncbi:DUF58 domain-containing protein [Silvimonas amylolytica]|uniref:DUF58 domain-containing protein n=1 Tax=Silvimonas amylolytica TaxID=449663 RepID=A0ABQ2PIJ2_9NEIS|nr:DUF58 domain-containing protein [Silvimonas amylolytica]GGP25050.1 hypothetical protein GCM10010971_08690 [Silvimonas amylolytica]
MAASTSEITAADIGTVWVDMAWLMRFAQSAAGLVFDPWRPRASVLAGRHASRLRGRGLDFEEIRGYLRGDDVRHIDWKASQRMGKPLVRVYTEERDRPTLFVVDQRISMFFGSQHAMKSVAAAELTALGAWMALQGDDRVGALLFNDSTIKPFRALRSESRVKEILASLADMNQALTANSAAVPNDGQLNAALEYALRIAGHDYLVCVVSDFAGADLRTRQLLRQLGVHNDVVAAMIIDPLFQSLPENTGRIVLTGGDLQAEFNFNASQVRRPVETWFRDQEAESTELLKGSGIPVLRLDARMPVLDQVRRMLGERRPHPPAMHRPGDAR